MTDLKKYTTVPYCMAYFEEFYADTYNSKNVFVSLKKLKGFKIEKIYFG